jgi:hypothetical protein
MNLSMLDRKANDLPIGLSVTRLTATTSQSHCIEGAASAVRLLAHVVGYPVPQRTGKTGKFRKNEQGRMNGVSGHRFDAVGMTSIVADGADLSGKR